jgi:hypothetical protein
MHALTPLVSGHPEVQNEEDMGTIHEQMHFEADMPDYGYIDRLQLDGYDSGNSFVTSSSINSPWSRFNSRHMPERTPTDQGKDDDWTLTPYMQSQ